MGVRAGHHEPPVPRPIELRAEPPLPAIDPLDLVEEIRAAGASFRLEGVHHQLERRMVERRREPRILEIHEQAPRSIECVTVHELSQERGFAGPTNPLDDDGDVGAELPGQPDIPRH